MTVHNGEWVRGSFHLAFRLDEETTNPDYLDFRDYSNSPLDVDKEISIVAWVRPKKEDGIGSLVSKKVCFLPNP